MTIKDLNLKIGQLKNEKNKISSLEQRLNNITNSKVRFHYIESLPKLYLSDLGDKQNIFEKEITQLYISLLSSQIISMKNNYMEKVTKFKDECKSINLDFEDIFNELKL